jgi:hypothetical protein
VSMGRGWRGENPSGQLKRAYPSFGGVALAVASLLAAWRWRSVGPPAVLR